MYGIDISNYQREINLSKGNYDFAIIKATEGINFTDKSFHKFAVQLTELNKLIGCYHFARPDLHGTISGMEQEADWFVKKVEEEGLLNRAILVLDWETEPLNRDDLVKAWIMRVEQKTGITPFIYASRSRMNNWKSWWAMRNCPIWMAYWPSIERTDVGPNKDLTMPSKNINWSIWQYSSSGRYPDFSGNVDLDYCELNRKEWLNLAGYEEQPAKETLSENMRWAIEVGILKGYGNGEYGPGDAITREQAITILRRFKDIYIR